jgi:hypothetical protein
MLLEEANHGACSNDSQRCGSTPYFKDLLTRARAAIDPRSERGVFRVYVSCLKEPEKEVLIVADIGIARVALDTLDSLTDASRHLFVSNWYAGIPLLASEILWCWYELRQASRCQCQVRNGSVQSTRLHGRLYPRVLMMMDDKSNLLAGVNMMIVDGKPALPGMVMDGKQTRLISYLGLSFLAVESSCQTLSLASFATNPEVVVPVQLWCLLFFLRRCKRRKGRARGARRAGF